MLGQQLMAAWLLEGIGHKSMRFQVEFEEATHLLVAISVLICFPTRRDGGGGGQRPKRFDKLLAKRQWTD